MCDGPSAKAADDGQGLRHIGDRFHVRLNAPCRRFGPIKRDRLAALDGAAHLFQHIQEANIALDGVGAEVFQSHGAAGHSRRREKVRRVRRISLDTA